MPGRRGEAEPLKQATRRSACCVSELNPQGHAPPPGAWMGPAFSRLAGVVGKDVFPPDHAYQRLMSVQDR